MWGRCYEWGVNKYTFTHDKAAVMQSCGQRKNMSIGCRSSHFKAIACVATVTTKGI